MQLAFEHLQTVGPGANPCAIHTAENIVQIIFVGANGSIYATEASTPLGAWGNREFTPAYMICDDVDVEYMKLKYIASSLFVVWKNDAEDGEVVPYEAGVVHDLRHRFAVWEIRQDLSKFLIDGSIDLENDDPIVRTSFSFENPNYVMSHEDNTTLIPGTVMTLFFQSGDSAKYIMGRYYIDTNDMSVGEATTSVEARNAIGKFLKDQTFNQDNLFQLQNMQLLGEKMFEDAGVLDFWVSETILERGMVFPPDMNYLDGFKELIKTALTWKIKETYSGQIGFGDETDIRFITPETYTFERNKDIFSRNVKRNDQDAYAKVCVKAEAAANYGSGTVNVGTLNLRPEPNVDNEPIMQLSYGDVVEVILEANNNFLEVNFGEVHGYVWGAYVTWSKSTPTDWYAYSDVDFRFIMGAKKTLHVTAAKGTTIADAQTYADELAALVGSAGTIETFLGPFRPHLIPGDNARIIGQTSKLIGLITSVKHKFGKQGFFTEFTVDSSLNAQKTKLSDYINKIAGKKESTQATRIY